MALLAPMLASSDDSAIKIVFGAIAFVVWLVSSAASAISKKAQEAKRRQLMAQSAGFQSTTAQPVSPPSGAAPPPLPFTTQAMRTSQQAVKRQPARKPGMGGKAKPPKVKTGRVTMAPPPVIAQVQQRRAEMEAPPTPTTHVAGGSAGSTTQIGGNRAETNPLAQLMRPKSLRTLLIASELLQPPVALRQEWDRNS